MVEIVHGCLLCRTIWFKYSAVNEAGRMSWCARCGGEALSTRYREIPATDHTKAHFSHAWESEGSLYVKLCGPCEASEHARELAVQTGKLAESTDRLAGHAAAAVDLLGVLTVAIERTAQCQEQLVEIAQRREAREVVQYQQVHGVQPPVGEKAPPKAAPTAIAAQLAPAVTTTTTSRTTYAAASDSDPWTTAPGWQPDSWN